MLSERLDEYMNILNEYEEKRTKKKERWTYIRIKGQKTHYAVSTHGVLFNSKTGKLIEASHYKKDGTISDRYERVKIKHDGEIYRVLLHRLVAYYFCKIPKRLLDQGLTYSDLVVNHKNGIKTCNGSWNLEWVTQKENMYHALKNNLCEGLYGENSHLSKISNKQAIQICDLIMEEKNNKEISEILGVTEKTVQHIRSGETWKNLVKKYNFPKLSDVKPYTRDEKQIHEACKLLELHKYSDVEIGNRCGLSREYVKDLRNKKIRTDISSLYNIDSSPVKPISESQIHKVCQMLSEKKYSQAKIAKECNISQAVVSYIYTKKKYTSISKNYNF